MVNVVVIGGGGSNGVCVCVYLKVSFTKVGFEDFKLALCSVYTHDIHFCITVPDDLSL